jgi:hypothetical protein
LTVTSGGEVGAKGLAFVKVSGGTARAATDRASANKKIAAEKLQRARESQRVGGLTVTQPYLDLVYW